MSPAALAERLASFIARPDRDSFDELALAAFAELYEADEGFRELCARAGAGPGDVGGWRSIPVTRAADRATAGGSEAGPLQREAADRAFGESCLEEIDSPPILRLVPGGETSAERALERRSTRLAERFGGPGSGAAVAGARLRIVAARSWLAARQRDRRAAVLLATRASLDRLLGALERQDLRFQLAPGSRVVVLSEPGHPPTPAGAGELGRRSTERLGLDPGQLRCELLWPALPTPLYGRPSGDGALAVAAPSPWLGIRALDPETLDELPGGEPGRLSVLDLTILDRPFHLLTPAHGSVEADAVRVHGIPREG